jgi:hypothetical protein
MNQYQIAIIALLAWQAVTLFLLWMTHRDREIWQIMWSKTAKELFLWKRNAVLRDPKTGKYHKRGQD